MSRRPARFTQADIYRAIKAIQQAGSDMVVEIVPDGTMRIVPSRLIKPVQAEGFDDEEIIKLC
jgi:hypothetical protein